MDWLEQGEFVHGLLVSACQTASTPLTCPSVRHEGRINVVLGKRVIADRTNATSENPGQYQRRGLRCPKNYIAGVLACLCLLRFVSTTRPSHLRFQHLFGHPVLAAGVYKCICLRPKLSSTTLQASIALVTL